MYVYISLSLYIYIYISMESLGRTLPLRDGSPAVFSAAPLRLRRERSLGKDKGGRSRGGCNKSALLD